MKEINLLLEVSFFKLQVQFFNNTNLKKNESGIWYKDDVSKFTSTTFNA